MYNTTIINPNREEIFYIKYLIDGIVESKLTARESLVETITTEKEVLVSSSVVIVTFNMKGFSNFLEIVKNDSTVNVIITYRNSDIELINENISYTPNITTFNIEDNDISKFEANYNRLLKMDERKKKTKEYCRVRIDNFLNLNKVICDVYLSLSNDKYVKVINRHQEFDDSDIEKYRDKNINFLYIKDNDFKLFINEIVRKIQKEKQSKLPVKINDTPVLPMTFQETVHEMVNKMGISTQALILTNEAINSSLRLISNTKIFDLLVSTIGAGTYISEVSMLTNYISCAICRESQWQGSDNYLRLSISSFFQDVHLNDDDLAKIMDTKGPIFEDLFNTDKKKIIDHPAKAAFHLEPIKSLPLGVDKILLNHHEKYDGSGFPRGINHSRIDPLTSIFIISLEIATILQEDGFSRDGLLSVVLDMEERYTKGSFAKVIAATKVAFGMPLIDYEDRQMDI